MDTEQLNTLYLAIGEALDKYGDYVEARQAISTIQKAIRPMQAITRFEVINHTEGGEGRAYVLRGSPIDIELSSQDNGQTLKVFLSSKPEICEECGKPADKDTNCLNIIHLSH